MERRSVVVATAVVLAVTLPSTLAAQEGHPNLSVGLSPTSTYDSSGIDNVDLFSGSLSMSIPIGPRYPVSSTLSYGLTAVYNSQVWDFHEVEYEGQLYTEANPSRAFNAGMGWTISFGELWDPSFPKNFSGEYLWISPNGSAHRFHSELHHGDSQSDGDSNVSYSRDGSYTRFVKVSNWEVWIETPDGLRRKYEKPTGSWFRLTRIENSHGNWMAVAYNSDATQWSITDQQGRAHFVYLFDTPRNGLTIDSIDFEGPNGQRLLWTFDYAIQSRRRSCKDTNPGNDGPNNNDRINLALLTRINRPDGSKFEMLEAGQPAYADGCGAGGDESGMLTKITLPTGGAIAYEYQAYHFPLGPPSHYTTGTGVGFRTMIDRDGTEIGTTIYSRRYDVPNKEARMRVVAPTGECTRHFFSIDTSLSSGPPPTGWDYGLPYTRRFTSGGRFLSSEVWTSHDFDG